MVLHLLGKKSWNVYNKDNVDRVRGDEAAAQAREDEAERRMQEEDAARRTAILRGEAPLPISAPSPPPGDDGAHRRRDDDHRRDRIRRRLRGEDDTDRDIRQAREDAEAGAAAREKLSGSKPNRNEHVSITDHAGHIQLFAAPDEKTLLASSRNAEAEAEKAKKAREYEDQYTMRFSNAAGFKQTASAAPWYAASSKPALEIKEPSKDVWGNEDPRRKDREQTRVSTNDPMAFMKRAQTQLKQAETDRERWKAEKEKELRKLEHAEKEEGRKRREHRHKHRHRERSRSVDSLEGFSLDAPARKGDKIARDEKRRYRERDRHDRRRRSKSRSRERRHGSSYRSSHRTRSRSPA